MSSSISLAEALKYPIGKYIKPEQFTPAILENYISTIAALPAKMRAATATLNDEQLDTPYRPDGWTVRQVVNHCSDSHMNAIIRLKLALTEEQPTITPYKEAMWAELADCRPMPIEAALKIVEGVHARWVTVLASMRHEQWNRTFVHPEYNRIIPLNESTGMYAWHCEHHLAHITRLKERMGWK